MTVDYETLNNLISEFNWHDRSPGDIWLVWSMDRNAVDPNFYFDKCLREAGNPVYIVDFGEELCLTVGEWLYFADKDDIIDRKSETVLLRRVKWSDVELVDVNKIKILTIHSIHC